MAQKVTHRVLGPPTIDDRFWEAYAAWCWGQREYAVKLMEYLIEDEVDRELRHDNTKKEDDGKTLTTSEEVGAPGYIEDGTNYAWNGWRFNDD